MNLLDAIGRLVAGATLVIFPATSSAITIKPEINTFQIKGEYQYLGQEVKYLALIPKSGGKISGEVNGVCNGEIVGTYQPGQVPEVKGEVKTKCRMAIISQNASARFSGRIDQGEKKAYLDWVGDEFIAGKRGSVVFDIFTNN